MGIVINQSIKNTIITYIGFAIGAANALYMYPHFLGEEPGVSPQKTVCFC